MKTFVRLVSLDVFVCFRSSDIAIAENKPIFIVSDLHIGVGKRNSFAMSNKEKLFSNFLDHIEKEAAKLVIVGDFLELWHSRIEPVLARYDELLHRLAEMDCTYILGNHDEEIASLIKTGAIVHPFFDKISGSIIREINGLNYKFTHGHEVDPFIWKDAKNLCRALESFAYLIDIDSDACIVSRDLISDLLLEVGEASVRVWSWLSKLIKRAANECCCSILPNDELAMLKRKGRTRNMLFRYRQDLNECLYDVVIVGHTHRAGRFSNWYYNSGSWTGSTNNYLKISPQGRVDVLNWAKTGPKANNTIIGI